MGFKSFDLAKEIIAGIELHRMLRIGQHIHTANMVMFKQFYDIVV